MKIRYKNLYILAKMLNRQKELQLSLNCNYHLKKIKGYEENKLLIPPPEKTLPRNKDTKKDI